MRKFIGISAVLVLMSGPALAEELLPNGTYITAAREAATSVMSVREKQDLDTARPYFTDKGWKNQTNAMRSAGIIDKETGDVIAPSEFDISDITSAGVVSTSGEKRTVKMKISDRSDSRYKGYTVTVVMTEEDDEAKVEQMIISPDE